MKKDKDLELIEDLEKYISFAKKKSNFSNEEDYKFHKDLSKRINKLIKAYKDLDKKFIDAVPIDIVCEKYIHKDIIEQMIIWRKVTAIQYELGLFKFKNKRRVKELWKEIELLEKILNGGE